MDSWPGERTTVQDSLFAEGPRFATHVENEELQNHSYGALLGSSSKEISFIGNVFTQVKGRAPFIAPESGGSFQLINTLVYDTCYSSQLTSRGECANYNAVGNVIIPGTETCGSGRNNLILDGNVRVFVQDNLTPYREAGEDEWMATSFFQQDPSAALDLRAETPFEMPEVAPIPALELQSSLTSDGGRHPGAIKSDGLILSTNSAGPNWLSSWRCRSVANPCPAGWEQPSDFSIRLNRTRATRVRQDSVDERVIGDIRARRGTHIDDPSEVGGWPDLEGGEPYPDEDADGIDDLWEAAHDLDASTPPDGTGDPDNDGYTNLEEFLNSTLP